MAYTAYMNIDEAIRELYSTETERERQKERYLLLVKEATEQNKTENERYIFSASGRIEVCGNHTDHQHGCVLTAAIERDIIAIANKNNTDYIKIHSKKQKSFWIDVRVTEAQKNEIGKSSGMVRGIAAQFKGRGIALEGCDIWLVSDIKAGSGISSSAAFEVTVATILDFLFNDSGLSAIDIAKICQFAEVNYFGKPCGLMDQAASANGGCFMIDFKNTNTPKIQKANMDCIIDGMAIFIVHTGANHTKLTREYASIVTEMQRVSKCFDKEYLREVDETVFKNNITTVRQKTGDRSTLRAMHFFAENTRVSELYDSLKRNDRNTFLKLINESGESSSLLLQNVYVDHIQDKSVALALALTKQFFANKGCIGACRIHGGGFAGTILAFVPNEYAEAYSEYMNDIFGADSADRVHIRKHGGIAVCKL